MLGPQPCPVPRDHNLYPAEPAWLRITAPFLESSRTSFMWWLAHGLVHFQARSLRRTVTPVNCPVCDAVETLHHTFSECLLPVAFLRQAADLFSVETFPFFGSALPDAGPATVRVRVPVCAPIRRTGVPMGLRTAEGRQGGRSTIFY